MTCRGSATTTQRRESKVHITVAPAYLEDHPAGDELHYFSYRITIHNQGGGALRLLSRYWKITDGNQQVQEVAGDGVVGQQPLIGAGGQYQYVSYVNFGTPVGYMEGHYTMETEDGERFAAAIGMFTLSLPGALQ